MHQNAPLCNTAPVHHNWQLFCTKLYGALGHRCCTYPLSCTRPAGAYAFEVDLVHTDNCDRIKLGGIVAAAKLMQQASLAVNNQILALSISYDFGALAVGSSDPVMSCSSLIHFCLLQCKYALPVKLGWSHVTSSSQIWCCWCKDNLCSMPWCTAKILCYSFNTRWINRLVQ